MRKILIAILLCWSASLYAAEDKKEYNASFSKDGVEEVVIVNSYGDVEISQAADSLCTVSAVVTVEAKSPEKVAEVLASVSITESVSGASRTFATGFGKDLGVKKAFAGVKVNSAYSIQVPRGMKVRVVNSAGNVTVGNFEGHDWRWGRHSLRPQFLRWRHSLCRQIECPFLRWQNANRRRGTLARQLLLHQIRGARPC